MLDIFAQFATDEALENNGVEVNLGEATFLIARSGNRKYAKMLNSLVERHQKTLDMKDDAADNVSVQIMIDTMADTILLGWKGVSFKGVELPYSKDNAEMLLGIKDFRVQIMKFADDVDAYRIKTETEQAKN